MAKFLFTADLHLTHHKRDEYRWGIFNWLKLRAEKRDADAIIIAGDVTDAKDNHSAALVNRACAEIATLAETAPVYVLMGNHDYKVDPREAFFGFTRLFGGVQFIMVPTVAQIAGKNFYFLPHTRNAQTEWTPILKSDEFRSADFVVVHHALTGARGSNEHEVSGFDPKKFRKTKAIVIAGDIHVPQVVDTVTYCGAPHPVHFGDTFQPRVLFFDGEKLISLKRNTLRKCVLSVRNLEELEEKADEHLIEPGDQVRIFVKTPRSEFPSWEQRKREMIDYAAAHDWYLDGVEIEVESDEVAVRADERGLGDSSSILSRFCESAGLDEDTRDAGQAILDEVE